MKRAFLISLSSTLLISCANWSGGPNPHLVGADGESQLIVKSGLFEHCGHFDNASVSQESAAAGILTAAAIEKVSEIAIDAFSAALNSAAENRNGAFTRRGKNADWLYKAASTPPSIMRCLVVVAGVKNNAPTPCEHDSRWAKDFKENECSISPITKSMQAWGIDQPSLYAEILLYFPEPSHPGYVLPKLVYSHYPEPLSSHKSKDLKNTLVSIKATSPGADNPIFEIIFKEGELAPQKEIHISAEPEALIAAPDSGEWLILPEDLNPPSTSGRGGALNIETSIIETPEPNKIIEIANEIVKENKTELSKEVNDKLSYALLSKARVEQRSAKAEQEESNDFSAITACKALEAATKAATTAKSNLAANPSDSALAIEHQEACLTASSNHRKSVEAWKGSSYSGKSALCFTNTISSNLDAACP